MTAKILNMPNNIFARARVRVEQLAEQHEAVELELDFTQSHTLASMLREAVDEVGPRGVYQELIR